MEQVKNILILSTSNPYKTAGVVAYDIYQGFVKNGFHTKLIVENYDQYPDDGIVSIQSKGAHRRKQLKHKIRNKINKVLGKNKPYTDPSYHFDSPMLSQQKYATQAILKKAGFVPDVIIVIFAQNFISYKNLKELQNLSKAPILWQFADMHPFTGGCHYAWSCKGYQSLCQQCPAILDKKHQNEPSTVLKRHLDLAKNLQIIPIIGSDWLIERAAKSALYRDKKIEKIYLSLDHQYFKPEAPSVKEKLRATYDVPQDSYVMLIMAKYLTHKRKGVEIILKALSLLPAEVIKEKKLHLFVIGGELEKMKPYLTADLPLHNLTSIDRTELKSMYILSDLFISASLQEVGPYTITEALLCSVPVVALDHGYAKEFVIDHETGFLIKDDEPLSLQKGILQQLQLKSDQLKEMKLRCRERTEKIVTKEKQIKQYIQLINSL